MRKEMKKITGHSIGSILLMLLIVGCAGVERSCSSCAAQTIGSDWIVVELRELDGTPYRCWMLEEVSIANEESSDGIYWKDPNTGNMVHVSGSYDRVQVVDDQWDEALAIVNLTEGECTKIRQSRYDTEVGEYLLPGELK